MTTWGKVILAMIVGSILSLVIVLLIASGTSNQPGSSVSLDSETRIKATVVGIGLPFPQAPIDASEDTIEPNRSWIVLVKVNVCLQGDSLVEEEILNLLVHSPSLSLGVSKVGQVTEITFRPTKEPVQFRYDPSRPIVASQLPDTQRRRFTIVSGVR